MSGECEGEEGANVGEEELLRGGNIVGSKSRSGIGGETNGRLVIFKRKRRKEALQGDGGCRRRRKTLWLWRHT